MMRALFCRGVMASRVLGDRHRLVLWQSSLAGPRGATFTRVGMACSIRMRQIRYVVVRLSKVRDWYVVQPCP